MLKLVSRIFGSALDFLFGNIAIGENDAPETKEAPAPLRIYSELELDEELKALELCDTLKEHVQTVLRSLLEEIQEHESGITYLLTKLYEFSKLGADQLSFVKSLLNEDRFFMLGEDRAGFHFCLSTDFVAQLAEDVFQFNIAKGIGSLQAKPLAAEILSYSKVKPNVDAYVADLRNRITAELVAGYNSKNRQPLKDLLGLFIEYFEASSIDRKTYELASLIEILLPVVDSCNVNNKGDWTIFRHINKISEIYTDSDHFDWEFFQSKILAKLLPIVKLPSRHVYSVQPDFLRSWLESPKIISNLVPKQATQQLVDVWVLAAEKLFCESIFQEKYIWFIEMFAQKIYPPKERDIYGIGNEEDDASDAHNLDRFIQKWIDVSCAFSSLDSLVSKLKMLKHFPKNKLNLPLPLIEKFLAMLLAYDGGGIREGWGKAEWENLAYFVINCKPQWVNSKWVKLIVELLKARPHRNDEAEINLYNKILGIVGEVAPETLDLALEILPDQEKQRNSFANSILWAAENWDSVKDPNGVGFRTTRSGYRSVKALTNEKGQLVLDKFADSDWIFEILLTLVDNTERTGKLARSAFIRSEVLARKLSFDWLLSRITRKDLPFAHEIFIRHFDLSTLTNDQLGSVAIALKAINVPDYDDANKARRSLVEKIEKVHPDFVSQIYTIA